MDAAFNTLAFSSAILDLGSLKSDSSPRTVFFFLFLFLFLCIEAIVLFLDFGIARKTLCFPIVMVHFLKRKIRNGILEIDGMARLLTVVWRGMWIPVAVELMTIFLVQLNFII